MADFEIIHSGNRLILQLEAKGHGGVMRELHDVTRDVGSHAVFKAHEHLASHVRTGNLLRATRMLGPYRSVNSWNALVGVAATAPYGKYIEVGTGIYGPRKSRIRPHNPGGALRFRAGFPVPGAPIYRSSVKGIRGVHFMRKAYDETLAVYVPLRLQMAAHTLSNL